MQVALAAGAAAVTVVDVNRDRLARAEQLGATTAVGSVDEALEHSGGRFDVLLECTGIEAVTSAAIGALRPAARAVLVGMSPEADMRLPVATMQAREIELVGTFRYANTYPAAIALATAGKVELDGLVDARFPLEDADHALRANRENPALLKVMVDVTVKQREGSK
jgi:L-iditol 2-dehydrogenase